MYFPSHEAPHSGLGKAATFQIASLSHVIENTLPELDLYIRSSYVWFCMKFTDLIEINWYKWPGIN